MISVSPRPRFTYCPWFEWNWDYRYSSKTKRSRVTIYNKLKGKRQNFQTKNVFIRLANGSGQSVNVLVTCVKLQNRVAPMTFIIVPNAENDTLFSIDSG